MRLAYFYLYVLQDGLVPEATILGYIEKSSLSPGRWCIVLTPSGFCRGSFSDAGVVLSLASLTGRPVGIMP